MNRDPSLPPEPLPLAEVSVQESQLELVRRRWFNQFDGPKIVANLRRHRDLWRAVIMDSRDLIKLRDLPGNYWNADTLHILCNDTGKGQRLLEIAEEEQR